MDENTCLTNRCEINCKTLEEALRAFLKSPVYCVSDVLMGCLMIAMLVVVIRTDTSPMVIIPFVVCVAMILFRYLFLPKYSARIQMKPKAELVGTDSFPVENSFLDSEILIRVVNDGHVNEELHVSYDKLLRVVETKNLIVLITKKRQTFSLDKNGFRNGTEEDFWRLIAEKCPEAKIKRR